MKVAALTMVYRDHWALSRWYAHHAAQFGAENLFVVAHGADPEISRLCPGASVLTIPRDDLAHFDRARAEMLNCFHAGLSKVYDWVIRTDADELICVDPYLWRDVPQALAAQDVPVVTALGFDLVEQPGDAPMQSEPVFAQRTALAFSGHYSKAIAARRAIPFHLHGVKVAQRRLAGFPFHMPRGLYLAHLKYANGAALRDAIGVRMAVAQGDAAGLPGVGWSEADADADRFHMSFAEKAVVNWDKAEARAHAKLSVNPARVERYSLVKTRALKFDIRTELPARFAKQG
ncbi:hypothetical protein GGQ68_001612 [Sagittula marina]|uniref:Glycosyl transferase family 2 n=1 Tax=Sagittula marina TaxID=943940 RepID=A0A7W6DLP9_9RHOB|nr:glycosyltransferase family 2 protein [Sagittula marina]MBB3985283.1 hypothetical protein [Sagittula marina]